MPDLSYAVRSGLWSLETTYGQDADALFWKSARHEGRVAYAAVREVQVYKVRYFGSRSTYWRCVIRYGRSRKIRLQAAHYSGFRRIEDRTATYIPFIKKLEARVAAANPSVVVRQGRNWLAIIDSVVGALLVFALKIMRFIGVERATAWASWLTRKIGPGLKGHAIARSNLIAAYPEKSASEIKRILAGMWDNIGRVFAEYPHLDRLWDFDPDRIEPGYMVLDEETRVRFDTMRRAEGPALIFSAHLANWELLVWALGCRIGETAVVYRPPKITAVEQELAKMRSGSKAAYIPAGVNAPFAIKNALRRGAWIGLLVDEHYARGVDVEFFGRPCGATPILAQLARRLECPIYGSRIVRLPDGKFRLGLMGPLAAPRDPTGKIDVTATMQMITGIIEGWIREHPEQWIWLHRRWR